ncbi:hypothetical protein FH063_002377 [Azospirillum argentinense]|uniref:Uncharacterized protein n=1 Tax=Azospirillum argentinense TaxID=2970906 RepID=A0A5B0KPC1_9PROT|nr:hypothetical protein FH063_002377 [Azospirillum argentinense]
MHRPATLGQFQGCSASHYETGAALPCRPDQDRRGHAGELVAQGGADGAGRVQDLEAAADGPVLAILQVSGAVEFWCGSRWSRFRWSL